MRRGRLCLPLLLKKDKSPIGKRTGKSGDADLITIEDVLRARADNAETEDFLQRHKQFILRCAQAATHRYVRDSDDEWSVALSAFHEALLSFDPEKGTFEPFAALIIRRRVTDFLRAQSRHSLEVSLNPAVFEGQIDPEAEDAALQMSVVHQTAKADDYSVKYEIDAVGDILSQYGFSFFDLPASSPKSDKTRRSCAAAIRLLTGSAILTGEMRRLHMLPMKPVSTLSGIPRKILDRHRKYIIAAAEILLGDFPQLQEYLRALGEEAEK